METYNLKVKNLKLHEAVQKIIRELKKLYDVKLVDVNIESSEVMIVLGELGSIAACKSALNGLGYPVVQVA
jgi:copper chaperone CopZ